MKISHGYKRKGEGRDRGGERMNENNANTLYISMKFLKTKETTKNKIKRDTSNARECYW